MRGAALTRDYATEVVGPILNEVVPGMPIGSPGMEVPGQPNERYDVIGFGGGANKVFMSFRGATPV